MDKKLKKSQTKGKESKSRSKSKKKSLSKYEDKYKVGLNSSSNKETYFLSKEIGLSSILENGTKSKMEKEQGKEKEGTRNEIGTGYPINLGVNLRKMKSSKNLKDFISNAYGKSTGKMR